MDRVYSPFNCWMPFITILSEIVIPRAGWDLLSVLMKNTCMLRRNDNLIVKYRINNNKLEESERIKLGEPWPVKISPAVCRSMTGRILYSWLPRKTTACIPWTSQQKKYIISARCGSLYLQAFKK
jgi:hypothetical protein